MMSQNVLNLELIEHETCSDLSLSSLQNILIFLYSKNLFQIELEQKDCLTCATFVPMYKIWWWSINPD